MNDAKITQVAVIGAGFAGIHATKTLAKEKNVQITLVDRRNYHLFQPLLYQVATAGLSPADIAVPVRSIFSKYPNVSCYLANIDKVDKETNTIYSGDISFKFDFIIMACGAKHSYFGKNEWEEFAP